MECWKKGNENGSATEGKESKLNRENGNVQEGKLVVWSLSRRMRIRKAKECSFHLIS